MILQLSKILKINIILILFNILSLTMSLDKIIDNAFHMINRARSNPGQLIDKCNNLANDYQGKIYKDQIKTRQGYRAVSELVQHLKKLPRGMPSLIWNFGLHMIADQQAKRLGRQGILTTYGGDKNDSLESRSKKYAIIDGKISQLYDFGGQNGDQIVQWLLIDDGLASRKRRNTLLDPNFRHIGIGTSLHRTEGIVTVIVLAESAESLVALDENGRLLRKKPLSKELTNISLVNKQQNKKLDIQKIIFNQYVTNNKQLKANPINNSIFGAIINSTNNQANNAQNIPQNSKQQLNFENIIKSNVQSNRQ